MKAFIIFHGNGGDYEDYAEDIETAFFDEQKAKSYVSQKNEALKKEVISLIAQHKKCDECHHSHYENSKEKSCYKPGAFRCQNYCYETDYESLEYRYEEIEIE